MTGVSSVTTFSGIIVGIVGVIMMLDRRPRGASPGR